LALPTRIGNYDGVGDVIDDNGVVDVVVDDVIRRRRDIVWRVDIDRQGSIGRNWKNVRISRRRWRSQIDKENRSRRQEKHWRWRWWFKSEIRVVENQYRSVDVNHLFRRRRRYVVGDNFKSSGRLESGRQICKPASRVVGMKAVRVTAQI